MRPRSSSTISLTPGSESMDNGRVSRSVWKADVREVERRARSCSESSVAREVDAGRADLDVTPKEEDEKKGVDARVSSSDAVPGSWTRHIHRHATLTTSRKPLAGPYNAQKRGPCRTEWSRMRQSRAWNLYERGSKRGEPERMS